jgi:hypothetical protein
MARLSSKFAQISSKKNSKEAQTRRKGGKYAALPRPCSYRRNRSPKTLPEITYQNYIADDLAARVNQLFVIRRPGKVHEDDGLKIRELPGLASGEWLLPDV